MCVREYGIDTSRKIEGDGTVGKTFDERERNLAFDFLDVGSRKSQSCGWSSDPSRRLVKRSSMRRAVASRYEVGVYVAVHAEVIYGSDYCA